MVSFLVFVRPARRRLLGKEGRFWHGARAGTLAARLPAAGSRATASSPTRSTWGAPRCAFTPFPPKCSHDLAAYAGGNALVRVPAGAPARGVGEACEVLLIAG